MEDETARDSSRRIGMRKSLAAMAVSTERRGWLAPLLQLSFNVLTLLGLFILYAVIGKDLFKDTTRQAERYGRYFMLPYV